MVCSTDDLVVWRDFPKGLRVLLLGEESPSAAETKLMLEAVDYVVSPFYNEKDALEAISNNDERYHVAIVEVTIGNSHGSFRFLEMAKDLPTVVISNIRCLSTMMKCIALGAAEFVQKPLSEDKLRNIWQHVVHKASNAGGNVLSKPLKPIEAPVVSMFQLQSETAELKIKVPSEVTNAEKDQENDRENTVTSDRFSAPSTPQLKQGVRLLDDGDCKEQPHFSTEKEGTESTRDLFELRRYTCSESQSVDNTCNNLAGVVNKQVVSSHRAEEEVDSADGSKAHECSALKEGSLPSSHIQNGGHLESRVKDLKKKNSTFSINSHSHGNRGNRKRMKVDWTPALHRQFVQAVEQLGIDQAIPSKILELMKVDGLTRHNVASHLQKFRMHRRHILPKDDDMRCHSHANPMPTGYMWKPLVALPAVSSNYVYPVWGNQSYLPPGIQMWGHTGFSWWQPPPNSWPWKTYPEIHADAWGCPVIPPYSQCTISPQAPPVSIGLDAIQHRNSGSKGCYDFDRDATAYNPLKSREMLFSPKTAEEVIDKVVKEAMSKPWLPLPLGLKPPSTDSVLAELHRLGIRTIPPPHSSAPPPPPPPLR